MNTNTTSGVEVLNIDSPIVAFDYSIYNTSILTSHERVFDMFEYIFYPVFTNEQPLQDIQGYSAVFYDNNLALGEKDGDIYFYDGMDIQLLGVVDDFLPIAILTGF